jgi:MFS family permease
VPIGPQLVADLGGGSVYFGVLVAAYGLLQWLATPLLGALSDRYATNPLLGVACGR